MDNIKVYMDNKEYEILKGTKVIDFLKENSTEEKTHTILVKYNNNLEELNMNILTDGSLEKISYDKIEGFRSYVSGLVFLLIVSIKELLGNDKDIVVEHSIDKGLFINTNFSLDENKLTEIKNKMLTIVNENRKIEKVTVSRIDALKYYKMTNNTSKYNNLKYNTNTFVTLYNLSNYYDYFYTKMPIVTGVLDKFDLTFINNNSLVLRFPTVFSPLEIPKYHHHKSMFNCFEKVNNWNKLMHLSNASDINEVVSNANIDNLIRICENNLNSEFLSLANTIINSNKKLVLMAGPSSSGKTTSSKKLCLALESLGKNPKVLSMDDYFVENDDTPLNDKGEKDYECLEAIDLELFDNQIKSLLDKEEVIVPTYNFLTGKKEYKKKLKMEEDAILVIEGIHALDDKILTTIERDNKFKIYVCPLTELNIDNHNRVSTTDNRILRRIVRDSKTRGPWCWRYFKKLEKC